MNDTIPTIAVLNSNEDTTEMVRAALQANGFSSVVICHITEIKKGESDFLQFLDAHNPRVFVWDISIPYADNWRWTQMLMQLGQMKGRRIVLTTTNKRALESMVGQTEAIEIVGKPYDLEQIVTAVKKAAGVDPKPETEKPTR